MNVTFLEVLTSVWNRVITNDHSTDIKQVLNGEMEDAECKCFTGRVSRLVNCLSGFDELVSLALNALCAVEVKIADTDWKCDYSDWRKAEGIYTVELHKCRTERIGIH